jgi:Cft2 family RNA processing exonuclease
VVNRTCARGDRIIVSAFAVGRTQQLVLPLHQLANAGQIPSIPIFVDSPLTVNVTEVFRKRSECFNAETLQYLVDGQDPFGFSRLQYIREAIESKKLNDLHGPFIAISAAGIRRAINGARRHFEPGRVAHARRSGGADGVAEGAGGAPEEGFPGASASRRKRSAGGRDPVAVS